MLGETKQIWNFFSIHAAVCLYNKNEFCCLVDLLEKLLSQALADVAAFSRSRHCRELFGIAI